jgi:hypothetical protein
VRKITIGFEFKHRAVIVNKLYFLNSTIKLYYFSTVGLIAAKVLLPGKRLPLLASDLSKRVIVMTTTKPMMVIKN